MSTRRKLLYLLLVAVVVLVILLVVVAPRLAGLDRYRPEVVARLEQGTGRSAEIGRLSLEVLPTLSVRADRIAIGNPPGFPEGHMLEIERVYADLDLGALLSRKIVVRALKLENPALNLISTSDGRWNTEGPARAGVHPVAFTPAAPASSLAITKVQLEDGRVTASNALPSGDIEPPSFEADGVSIELEDLNLDALGLNFRAGFNLGAPRPAILPVAWPAPEPDQTQAGGSLARPQGPLAARGTFSAKSARFNAAQAGNLKSGLELYAGGAMLNHFGLELAGGQVSGDLVWDSAAQPARFTTQVSLANVDLARLLANFPGARGKITGKLDGNLKLSGWNLPSADPLANKEGDGNIVVHNGALPTLQLNRTMTELMRSILKAGPSGGDPSSFKSITADLEIGHGVIRSRQITILGNGVDIDASGALALAGAGRLDYQGVGKLDARQNGFEGIVAGLLGSKVSAGGKIPFSFILTGTPQQPRFTLKNSPFFR